MHIIIAAEGYVDSLAQFEKDFSGKIYANGKAKLRMREIKLYTCSINESGKDEFLSDVHSLCGGLSKPVDPSDPKEMPSSGTFDWKKAMGIVKFFLGPLGLKPLDVSKYPNSRFRGPEVNGQRNYNAHFFVIGTVDDKKGPDGSEIV